MEEIRMNQQVVTHWNEFSSEYDNLMQKDKSYVQQLENIVSHIDTKPVKILDLGCGTGALTQRVLTKYPDVNVVCLDPATTMLDIVNKKFSNFNVETVQGSAHAMEFEDNTFDYIMTNWALHHLTNEDKILCAKELFRVLKPEGKLILGDQFAPIMREDVKDPERVEGIFDLLSQRAKYYFENVSFERMILQVKLMPKFLLNEGECLATVEYWEEHLKEAGFSDVKSEITEPGFLRNHIIIAYK